MQLRWSCLSLLALLLCHGCSPLKSSPDDDKHKLELTLHEFQTNLDDVKHDVNCFQTDLSILDEKIAIQDRSLEFLKTETSEKLQDRIALLSQSLSGIERKLDGIENRQKQISNEIEKLFSHANETTTALTQHQQKINELQQESYAHTKTLQEIAKLKPAIQNLVQQGKFKEKVHTVKSGETLDKIAKQYKTSIDKIKKANDLKQEDLIFAGQELIIPRL